jgi:hypothetical protein
MDMTDSFWKWPFLWHTLPLNIHSFKAVRLSASVHLNLLRSRLKRPDSSFSILYQLHNITTVGNMEICKYVNMRNCNGQGITSNW